MLLDRPVENIVYPFNTYITNVCKGVAILLLLWHHLAPHCENSGVVVKTVGSYGKVCVSIFLLLSGYGLMKSMRQGMMAQLFRIVRLYVNFWFVAIVFISLALVFCGRTPSSVYASHPWLNFVAELLCLKGVCSYNPTWWFMKTILILYILFPMLKCLLVWNWLTLVLVCIFFTYFKIQPSGWVIPFTIGMVFAKFNLFEKYVLNRFLLPVSLVVLLASVYVRPRFGVFVDGPLAAVIVYLLYSILNFKNEISSVIASGLDELGKYSMDIFLLHTFIYYIFFPEFYRGGIFGLVMSYCC